MFEQIAGYCSRTLAPLLFLLVVCPDPLWSQTMPSQTYAGCTSQEAVGNPNALGCILFSVGDIYAVDEVGFATSRARVLVNSRIIELWIPSEAVTNYRRRNSPPGGNETSGLTKALVVLVIVSVCGLFVPPARPFIILVWIILAFGATLYYVERLRWFVGILASILLLVAMGILLPKGRGGFFGSRNAYQSRDFSLSEVPTRVPDVRKDQMGRPVPAAQARDARIEEEVPAGDPFTRMAEGRVVKRALPDLEELLKEAGMIEVFKNNSKRLPRRSSEGREIWQHSAGIYMAVPAVGAERLFSSIAAARNYYDRHTRQS